jgi:ABC-2 type transport system ATP-binding protein
VEVISVKNLSKNYYIAERKTGFFNALFSIFSNKKIKKNVLDNISFDVEEGELVGFIGPNGAGKSTTIKILSGILLQDEGSVNVLGKNPFENRNEIVKALGIVFGQRTQLWWDLPVIESFELLKEIYHLSDSFYKTKLDSLIEILDLCNLLNIPSRQLSLGQRMRCDLAASLLHDPKILFLDEPTIGLDATSKLSVRNYIKFLNEKQKLTIILTTHDMDDIEALCQRVLIINKGKLILEGSLDLVRRNISEDRWLILDLVHENETISDPDAKLIKQEGCRIWLSYNPKKIVAAKLIARLTSKHEIEDLFVQNQPIEEIIAKFYKESK